MPHVRWWSDPIERLGLEAERETRCKSPAYGIVLGACLGALGWVLLVWLMSG